MFRNLKENPSVTEKSFKQERVLPEEINISQDADGATSSHEVEEAESDMKAPQVNFFEPKGIRFRCLKFMFKMCLSGLSKAVSLLCALK